MVMQMKKCIISFQPINARDAFAKQAESDDQWVNDGRKLLPALVLIHLPIHHPVQYPILLPIHFRYSQLTPRGV